jgi:hypothetical protein
MRLTHKSLLALVSAALLLASAPARPGGIPLRAGIWQGVSVTTSSQQIIGPSSALPVPVLAVTTFLYLENVDQTSTICISFKGAATISGTTCSAGEITLQPGAYRFFDVALPTDAVHAIASSAATPLTIGAQ